ncbi:uncharacterized protein LOC116211695 [Punica granatum]|uniref:Uncharacterized protein LOC116211695 n=1 Tax=Punica granatum TaxID=22663 RepID=A0A6P8E9N8_PUNGR|nr:uncharacterized protein LOC116211695 [Punica granatum]
MGSACCVAARDRNIPNRTATEALQRSVLYSPSWSFRWENRRRVAGEIDNISSEFSHGISSYSNMQVKKPISSLSCNTSDRGDQVENLGTPASHSFPAHEGVDANSMTPFSDRCTDISAESNCSVEVKNAADSLGNVESLTPKISFSATMPSSFSTPTADHLSPQNHAIPPHSTPSRRVRDSPGRQLLRQISDSRILKMKSPRTNSVSEGRSSSFALSTCSHDFMAGSQGSFSDCWSMQTFSELVSSQRHRWSFESEQSSDRLSCSPSSDLRTCEVCRKLLKEKIDRSDCYSIVAVLVCGHFFHAECLDRMTKEADKYDPVCPICTFGEKRALKMSKKASKAEARRLKTLKNRVVDSCFSGELDFSDHHEAKVPKLGASSSSRKPFLTRHFSLGSKWGRSLSENDTNRKKSFWSRYRKN